MAKSEIAHFFLKMTEVVEKNTKKGEKKLANFNTKTCWSSYTIGDVIVRNGKIYRVAATSKYISRGYIPVTRGIEPPEGRKIIIISAK